MVPFQVDDDYISLSIFNLTDRCADPALVKKSDFPEYDGYDKKTANALLVLAGINIFVIG